MEPGEWLRCPGERAALALCVASNFLVLGLAVMIVVAGTAWLGRHPVLAESAGAIRTVLLAALLAAPTTAVLRNVTFAAARGNGVRVGPDQFPELHAQLLAACRKLGVREIPELYVSREVETGVAVAHTIWGGRAVVVVNAELMDENWREGLDWLGFAIAGAVGSIRLGHTGAWVELLTVYSRRIPGLRSPVLVHWARSRDRCAAYVVPHGIRGLIVEAVGNHALPAVDVRAFIEQTEDAPSLWDALATRLRRRPLIVARARALYQDGLFDRGRDRERFRPSAAPSSPS